MARYINKYETDSDYQDAITDNEYSGTTYDVANTSLINDTRRKKYDHKITLGTGSILSSLNNGNYKPSKWLVDTNIATSSKLKLRKGFGMRLSKNQITNIDSVFAEMSPTEIMHSEFSESTLISITIPEGVTHIYAGAFKKCRQLTEVKLPSTLQYIGRSAFKECKSLTKIVIPASVTVISSSAFACCTSLTEVIFAEGNQKLRICDGAFKRCKSLVSISLPDRVTAINKNTFKDCVSLRYISIGSGLKFVVPGAFKGCLSLERIDSTNNPRFRTENGVTIMTTFNGDKRVERVIHVNTSLTEVVIPAVNSIHHNVLRNCGNLVSVTCLGVNAPYHSVFLGCHNLESVVLHDVKYNKMNCAFINCPKLTDLTIIPTENYYRGSFATEYANALSIDGEGSAFGTINERGFYLEDHDDAISNIDLHVPSQYVSSFTNIGFNSVTAV